jgi:NitT/TauT family transport system substrate-binding protein
MGGPQVNGLQLLAAGQLDVVMATRCRCSRRSSRRCPSRHRGDVPEESDGDHRASRRREARGLKGKPIAVSAASNTTFWPWLKQRYGFTDDQKRPYAFSVQPFLVDKTCRSRASRRRSRSRSRKAA